MKKISILITLAFVPACVFAASGSPGRTLFAALLLVALFVGIFLILRNVNCWYWKINESLKNQEEIIRLLKSIDENMKREERTDKNNHQSLKS